MSQPQPLPAEGCNPNPSAEYVRASEYVASLISVSDPHADPGVRKEGAGRLWAERLPRDAWERWCKHDGVVCFSLSSQYYLKIYFVNPRNPSRIYHVVDFDYTKFHRKTFANTGKVGHILVGSKIYVIGGSYDYSCGPLDVHYCDVNAAANGGYNYLQWMPAPYLNSRKPMPCLFTLAGNIYALSVSFKTDDPDFKPFEVLKNTSDDHDHDNSSSHSHWQVLDCPFDLENDHSINGTLVLEDTQKFLVHHTLPSKRCELVSIYDAKLDRWTTLDVPSTFSSANLSACLSADDIPSLLAGSDAVFLLSSFNSFFFRLMLKEDTFNSRSFNTSLLTRLGLDEATLLGKLRKYPYDLGSSARTMCWHLLPLARGSRGTSTISRRFFFIGFFNKRDPGFLAHSRFYIRFGTLDLVQRNSAPHHHHHHHHKAKRRKLGGGHYYEVANYHKIKTIVFGDEYDPLLLPKPFFSVSH
ncbi:hypothetical protein CCACVL1_23419 [Corchorus capsularis]|uniref:Uncharacterized protein n=1 Tax=Corchorus capsularis TaxID=210143 RepID=A0A1R3GU33_COCAP|nr:hypothetical protein CCACVL1_23419 [Corchorus capsularis]